MALRESLMSWFWEDLGFISGGWQIRATARDSLPRRRENSEVDKRRGWLKLIRGGNNAMAYGASDR